MLDEFRVIGPPGCGKTHYLLRQVESAVEKHGRDSVVVTSLTNAAKNAALDRGLPIPNAAIGTLHSLAKRRMGDSPPLAMSKGTIDMWNTAHNSYRMTAKQKGADGPTEDEFGEKSPGDKLLEKYSAERCRMKPREKWTDGIRGFASKWEEFKADTGTIDFTDMIERALVATDTAPGSPQFIFCDEAQDMDKLQLSLVRKWAERCEKLILIGDPDQNLYEWRGTDPDNFINPPIPESCYKPLAQSWRVPREVHRVALRWVRKIKNRIDCEYHPRDDDGWVESMDCPYSDPEDLIPRVKACVSEDKKVLILATCHYMLQPIMRCLRDAGIPYHNEYSDRTCYNPLANKRRAIDYLATDKNLRGQAARLWTWKELRSWTEHLRTEGILAHGAKEAIKRRADEETTATEAELSALFVTDPPLNDLKWLERNQTKGGPRHLGYMARIARVYGTPALIRRPLVNVGTIHSVKGGEADVVFLSLALSKAELESYSAKSTRFFDQIIRKFYVGMTRAKEGLVLLEESGINSIEASDVL